MVFTNVFKLDYLLYCSYALCLNICFDFAAHGSLEITVFQDYIVYNILLISIGLTRINIVLRSVIITIYISYCSGWWLSI